MIYEVKQLIILDNGKLYNNMFYVLEKDLPMFLKYITSDAEGIKTYTYSFSNNLVRLYEKVGNHFKWMEYRIFPTDEYLIEEDELFILDEDDDYPRGEFITNLQELMFKEVECINSLQNVIKEANKYN